MLNGIVLCFSFLPCIKKPIAALWALVASTAFLACHIPQQPPPPPCEPCAQPCARAVADAEVQRQRRFASLSQWQVTELVDSLGYAFIYHYPPESGIVGGGVALWVDVRTCTIVKKQCQQ